MAISELHKISQGHDGIPTNIFFGKSGLLTAAFTASGSRRSYTTSSLRPLRRDTTPTRVPFAHPNSWRRPMPGNVVSEMSGIPHSARGRAGGGRAAGRG